MNKNFSLLLLVIVTAFVIRAMNLTFPTFTPDEARVVFRGYTIATSGKDELGRSFPLLFNSLQDYQLPIVSYLTAGGELVFGKSEFGARIPFIVFGTALVLLTYQIAKFFSQNSGFWFTSAFVVAFSPSLIFLSKVPNEAIVLTSIFTLLFYLLINKKNIVIIILTMIASVLASKQAWFILLPYTFSTVIFFHKPLDKRRGFTLISFSAVIVFLAASLFLTVPQAKRSLLENNFSIFSDVTIKNGINTLRGQGMQSGWPGLIDKLMFNKSHFLTVGLLHWVSHLNPAIYFGQFDESGRMSFSYLGAWVKILVIPFALGLYEVIRKGDKKGKSLLVLFFILTYPSAFIYPNYSLELVVLTLPFMALIISSGLIKIIQFNRKISVLIVCLLILELVINIYNFLPEYKNTNIIRPGWIKGVVTDVFDTSKNNQTAVSDDIVSDIVPFIGWYVPKDNKVIDLNIPWPYKFRQYNLSNIQIIGSNEKFRTCSKNEKLSLFVSIRDLNKIQREFKVEPISKYQDNLLKDKAFLMPEKICLN